MRGKWHKVPCIALAALHLAACDARPDQWDAFIYPDKSDLATMQKIEGFRTLEFCRKAALDYLRLLPTPGYADYACGHKCGTRPGRGSFCAEMRK